MVKVHEHGDFASTPEIFVSGDSACDMEEVLQEAWNLIDASRTQDPLAYQKDTKRSVESSLASVNVESEEQRTSLLDEALLKLQTLNFSKRTELSPERRTLPPPTLKPAFSSDKSKEGMSFINRCQNSKEEPFLVATQVISGSPAHHAGIRRGDVFFKFGPYTAGNFKSLKDFVELASRGKTTVHCIIGRGQTSMDNRRNRSSAGAKERYRYRLVKEIKVTSIPWDLGFVFGFVLNCYPEPIPTN